jgi:hypothetical protein
MRVTSHLQALNLRMKSPRKHPLNKALSSSSTYREPAALSLYLTFSSKKIPTGNQLQLRQLQSTGVFQSRKL